MANRAPKAKSDSYSTNENSVLKIAAAKSVLKNDSDPTAIRYLSSS